MRFPLFFSRKRHWVVTWIAMAAGYLVTGYLAASADASGAIAETITKTGLAVIARDFVQMPQTGGSPSARINFLREEPGGSDRLFVNDLNGYLYTVDKSTRAVSTYLDFTTDFPELKTSPGLASGLVSFAFDPMFSTNGKFYTIHSENLGGPTETSAIAPPLGNFSQYSVLNEWTATDPTASIFSGTQREIMRIGTPGRFHPMGDLGFNPTASPGESDYGQLYVAIGDGQSFNMGDAGNLQRLDSYLGTIIRIDPDPNSAGNSTLSGNGQYRIPNDNPWASDNDSDPNTFGEIYAYGFRNPHRMSWDPVTETMFAMDIGEDIAEEVNIINSGDNYGWSDREGTFLVGGGALPAGDSGFTYPVAQYDHNEGHAIAGGFAYRGDNIPALQGKFVFGDIVNGRIFYSDVDEMITVDDGNPSTTATINELQLIYDGSNQDFIDIVSGALGKNAFRTDLRLGIDDRGELYLMSKQDGWIREVLPQLPSDFDIDGDVDRDDLALWQGGFGIGTTNAEGDADGDNDVDGRDFLDWQREFNSGTSAITLSSLAVPEPTSLGLLGLGLALLLYFRTRHFAIFDVH